MTVMTDQGPFVFGLSAGLAAEAATGLGPTGGLEPAQIAL